MFSFLSNSKKRYFHILMIALLAYEVLFQGLTQVLWSSGIPLFSDGYAALIVAGLCGAWSMTRLLRAYLPPSGASEAAMAPPTPATIFLLVMLIFGTSQLASFLAQPILLLLYQLGFSLNEATAAATGSPLAFWPLFYSILAAPILEEYVFRRLILGTLRPYGSCFALLISALLFGLMHGNIVQLVPASCMGLLFGYAALRYGLKTSIFMHMFNNLFTELLAVLLDRAPGLTLGMNLLATLGFPVLVIWLIMQHRAIAAAFTKEKSLGPQLRSFFTTPSVLLVLAYFILMTLTYLS